MAVLSVAVIGGLIVLAVNLSHEGATNGVVTGKRYVPSSSGTILVGKVMVPTQDPECWRVEFRDDETGRTGSTCVSQAQYDAIPIGAKV